MSDCKTDVRKRVGGSDLQESGLCPFKTTQHGSIIGLASRVHDWLGSRSIAALAGLNFRRGW